MDLDTVDAADFGQSLRGVGLNLLVRDVGRSLDFLRNVLGMDVFQASDDFAILRSGAVLLQIHADHTYHSNPLAGILPEAGARGAGVELRLYEVDPETALERAQDHEGATLLQEAKNKPHGLREAYILDLDGYCWVPSRPLTPDKMKALDQ